MFILLGLYTALVGFLVIVVVQFIMTLRIWNKLKELSTKIDTSRKATLEVNETEGAPYPSPLPTAVTPSSVSPSTPQPTKDKTDEQVAETPKKKYHTTPVETKPIKSRKERVLEAIQAIKIADIDNLPSICKELKQHFSYNMNKDYLIDLSSSDYFRFIDLRDKPDIRVVVIGDIHCDFYSLAAILIKLSTSEYDYFEKAIFVFLGDYLDRGDVLFEPLLLLRYLKAILGDRMVMLKGNHESLSYNTTKKEIETKVVPNQSCGCLNQYCGQDQEFLSQFAAFYSTLPTYVYLKVKNKNIILTHAAIPRDIYLDSFYIDESNGNIVFEDNVKENDRLKLRNAILKDMIWGDPEHYEEKIQVKGRFEFGSKQFMRFARKNRIDLLFRSHEETPYGFEPFFNERLFTLFSTGGEHNSQTDYSKVEPAFAIIQNELFFIENSFIYQIKNGADVDYINPFCMRRYTSKQIDNYKTSKEFTCEKDQFAVVKKLFQTIKRIFNE